MKSIENTMENIHTACKGLFHIIYFLKDREYRDLYEKTEKARLEWEAAMLKFCQVKYH